MMMGLFLICICIQPELLYIAESETDELILLLMVSSYFVSITI